MILYCFEDKIKKTISVGKKNKPLDFKAKGIVLVVQYPYDRPDGEVFAVLYQDHNNKTRRAWRRPEEIHLYKITEKAWKLEYDKLTKSDHTKSTKLTNTHKEIYTKKSLINQYWNDKAPTNSIH